MDRISQLHDELLLGILSSLPTVKDVVATMILSKRWQFLWMMVPRLVYDGRYLKDVDYGRFRTFVDSSFLLHKAPVLETLHFKIGKTCGSGDIIPVFLRAADKRCVHELIIEMHTPVTLPRNLFTCCKKLVILKLSDATLVDDSSSPNSFPSLKKLSLISMKYPDDEFVNRIISSCPILEDLVVEQTSNDNVAILRVRVPSLKRLVLDQRLKSTSTSKPHGCVIDTPSLECLDIVDFSHGGFQTVENDMPKIVKANVDLFHPQSEKILDFITLAKHLHLCFPTSKNVSYPSVFHGLVHLKLCTCEAEWLDPLMRLLRNSPSLRVLELEQAHFLRADQKRPCWNEPSLVPECLINSLETFKWKSYDGTKEEREVAAFILRSASCLKKATIILTKSIDEGKKLDMSKELSLMSRCSPACQLAFS